MADSFNFDEMLKDFRSAVGQLNNKTNPFDSQAEVLRVEGDTAWVHIPGGVDETPVKLTTNAKAGDVVSVGDEIIVKALGPDKKGRQNFSRKDALPKKEIKKKDE